MLTPLPHPKHSLTEAPSATSHLEVIEALWVRRRAMMFDSRRSRAELCGVAERFGRAHAALSLSSTMTQVRLCAERLRSPVATERFSAWWLIASIAPTRGWSLLPDANDSFPWVDAMRHAPSLPVAFSLTHGPSLDAASFHAAAPAGVLLGALYSLDPELLRAALLAAGRHPDPPDFALRAIRRIAVGGDPVLRPVALYALGLASPVSWERFVLEGPTDALLGLPHGPFLAGLFGDDMMRQHLERACIRVPSAALIRGLGLLGYPKSFPLLRSLLLHESPVIRQASAHALFDAGGTASFPEAITPDVRSVLQLGDRDPVPDESAMSVRHHRGRPLLGDAENDLVTHAWLRAILTRSPSKLRFELPDGMFGEGYHARGYGPHNLGATA